MTSNGLGQWTVMSALLLVGTSRSVGQSSFQGLGSLGSGSAGSLAARVSRDGLYVTGSSDGQAFLWSAELGMIGIGQLPQPFEQDSQGLDVSNGGTVIAGLAVDYQGKGFPTSGFCWTSDEGFVALGGGICEGGSVAFGLSDDGSVAVGEFDCRPFHWTVGGQLRYISGQRGRASAASSSGDVIVGYAVFAPDELAFRWTSETGMVGLGDLPGGRNQSYATGVSGDGTTIVGNGRNATNWEAFRWTEATGMIGLGGFPEGPPDSAAVGVSGDGAIVVGAARLSANTGGAFIWDAEHGLRDLQEFLVNEHGLEVVLTGWYLWTASGISSNGRAIVGTGLSPEGRNEAWIAYLGGPTCRPDFNADAILNSQDFFDYLLAFFAGEMIADFNRDKLLNSQDFFDYLAAFFAGCAP